MVIRIRKQSRLAFDRTGIRYGRLVVIKRAENRTKRSIPAWLCQCDCGNKTIVIGEALQTGYSRSCGCLKKELGLKKANNNWQGKKFNRLLVISRHSNKKNHFLCQCDCGNKIVVLGSNLKCGATKSCGCYRKELDKMRKLPSGEAHLNSLFSRMKSHAKKRFIEWELTKEQTQPLIVQNCHYCGIEPKQNGNKHRGLNGTFYYNGLDRIDSKKGYFIDNVIPCCGTCNRIKLDMTVEEFRKWIIRAYQHLDRWELANGHKRK